MVSEESVRDYVQRVRSYYDDTNDLYLRYLGRTCQAGLVTIDPGHTAAEAYRAHNLYCASRAGVQPGDRVLDAGCGTGGPSVDIATAFESVEIDAVTLSPRQARSAREHIKDARLTRRVRIYLADFHWLPFQDSTFDVVLFLESAGYSYDPRALFREAVRVLRPGGRLYVKDLFAKDPPLDPREQQAMEGFNRVYAYRTATLSSTLDDISSAGCADVVSHDLTDRITVRRFEKARYHSMFVLSPFGQYHQGPQWGGPPIRFVDVTAIKR